MFFWIYNIPSWLLGTMFAIFFAGVACVSIIIARPLVRKWVGHFADNSNEVIGNVVSGYMALYGILLALIAVGAYQNLSNVDDIVSSEASNLGSLYRDISAYPDPPRTELQVALREYCIFIVERGWPEYRKGNIPPEGTSRINDFQKDLFRFQPQDKAQEILHTEAIHQFNAFAQARRKRLQSINTGLPTVLWYVVWIGAFMGIFITCFFSFERLSFHLTIAGLLWTFTGLVVFLIAAMDYPLRGDVSISPEAFQNVLDVLMKSQ